MPTSAPPEFRTTPMCSLEFWSCGARPGAACPRGSGGACSLLAHVRRLPRDEIERDRLDVDVPHDGSAGPSRSGKRERRFSAMTAAFSGQGREGSRKATFPKGMATSLTRRSPKSKAFSRRSRWRKLKPPRSWEAPRIDRNSSSV